MSAATYRIGPSDFFLPGDLAADANTVDLQVTALDAELTALDGVPVAFHDAWTAYEGQWRAFYADHFGGFFSNFLSALNNSNRDDLIRYENQLATFQDQAKAFGADTIAPVTPSEGTQDTISAHLGKQLPDLKSVSGIVVLVAAAIVLILVWKS
jgi:hypothetical protein